MKKVRNNFNFTEAQAKWLAEQAKNSGLTEAEILRRILDEKRLAEKR